MLRVQTNVVLNGCIRMNKRIQRKRTKGWRIPENYKPEPCEVEHL